MIARSPGCTSTCVAGRVAAFGARALLAALVPLAVLAGCEDPSLRVVVERPPAYASLVTRVEISVYERDGLTCDDIAYDKLSADELRAILHSTSDRAGDLDAIPRLGHKAVVARGYGRGTRGDSSERLAIAGCTELDEIGDDERIVITTEPVATAATDASLIAGGKGAVEIAVVAIDVNQKGINGKEVRLTTYGPSGSFPASGDIAEAATPAVLAGGEGQLRPMTPNMVGPYAVQVRVKWSTGLPPPVNAMMVDAPIQRTIGALGDAIINACTIYSRAGEPTLACLERDTPATRFVRSYRLSGGALTQSAAQVAVAATATGVFGLDNGVVVVSADGAYTGILGATVNGSLCNAVGCGAATVADALAFTACGSGSPGLFAHLSRTLSSDFVATILPSGEKRTFTAPSGTANSYELNAAGCVTDLESGGQPQAAVTVNAGLNTGLNTSRSVLYLLGSGPAPTIDRSRERRQAGSGFTLSGTEARLLTTEFDPTGVIVVESVLNKPLNAYRLFERRRSPAVAPPRHYVSGNFDLDDEADIAWDVLDDLSEAQNRAIQMLLASRPGRPTLIGRMPLGDTADLLTADLDGDGLSELIGYSSTSVSVQRFGTLSR